MKENIVKGMETLSIFAFAAAFFYFDKDLIKATMVFMVSSTLFILFALMLKTKLNKLQWGTWIVLMVLGGITVIFQDEQFIKWKTTIIHAILAAIFAISQLTKQTITEKLLAGMAELSTPKPMLRKLNIAAIFYFLAIAGLNLYFAYNVDSASWLSFKLVGLTMLHIVFFGGVLYYLKDYLHEIERKLTK